MHEANEGIRQFTRGAWLVTAVALLLILLSVGQLVYRYTLPTDGWSVYAVGVEVGEWVYDASLVGAPSALQADDVLHAVDGRSEAIGTNASAPVEPPTNWHVGGQVTYTVQRSGQTLDIDVPVVSWTLAALWRYNTGSLSQFLFTLGAFVFLGLGWFTFLRRPDVPSARALLIFSTAVGAAFVSGLLPDGLSVQFDPLAFYFNGFFSYVIFGALLAPSLLAFTLLFPQPKRVIQRHPALIVIPVLLGIAVLIAVGPLDRGEYGWYATLGMFLASIASLIHSALTQRDAVSRAQLRWAIGGLVAGLVLFLFNFPTGFGYVQNRTAVEILGAMSSLAFVVIGATLSIAILRYRLFDVDVIIRRTLIYGLSTAVLVGVYFGLVLLAQSAFVALTGQESPLAIVISTLVIAALFNPLRRAIQNFIDRRFYRRKYDAEQILARFAQTARQETDLEALQAELLRVVQETMQPESAAVWIKK